MKARIVIRCFTLVDTVAIMNRIRGVVAHESDVITRMGMLVNVETNRPIQFIRSYLEEGFQHAFTFEVIE